MNAVEVSHGDDGRAVIPALSWQPEHAHGRIEARRAPCRPTGMHRSNLPLLFALLTGCGTASAAGMGGAMDSGPGYGLSTPELAQADAGQAKAPAPRRTRAFDSGERADYLVTVLGIPAAEGHLSADRRADGDWTFEAGGEALPWLALFYDLRLEMTATASAKTLKPRVLARDGVNGGWVLKRDVKFRGRGRVRIAQQKQGSKRMQRYRRRTTRDANDPLSVVFAMRQAMLQADDPADLVDRSWHAFDGAWTRRLTVVSAAPTLETLETDAGTFRTRRVRVRIHRIQVKGDRRIPTKKDDRTWDIWATADDRGVIVAAEGEGPFGSARAELTRFRAASPPRAIASARP